MPAGGVRHAIVTGHPLSAWWTAKQGGASRSLTESSLDWPWRMPYVSYATWPSPDAGEKGPVTARWPSSLSSSAAGGEKRARLA